MSCHDSDPLAVANDIFKFAKFVQVEFDVSVFICQILFRNVQECRWPCRPDYNTQVTTTNNTIWDLCKNHMAIRYWHHRRMSQNWRQYIDNDGVHLSDIGMTKYYKQYPIDSHISVVVNIISCILLVLVNYIVGIYD